MRLRTWPIVAIAAALLAGCGGSSQESPVTVGTSLGTSSSPSPTASKSANGVVVSSAGLDLAAYCKQIGRGGTPSSAEQGKVITEIEAVVNLARPNPDAKLPGGMTFRSALSDMETLAQLDCDPVIAQRLQTVIAGLP